jgi:ferrous iron transport protein A
VTSEPSDAAQTLADLPVGRCGRIASVDVTQTIQQRLFEMGLTEGTQVEVVRLAPLGDPIEIRVRGYLLSLRKQHARGIHLTTESS